MQRPLSLKYRLLLLINGHTGLIILGVFIFTAILSMGTNWTATILFQFESKTTEGHLTLSELTSHRINHGPCINYYEFKYAPEGEKMSGYSYGYKHFKQGETVQIEYSTLWPAISRIKGTTRSSSGKDGKPFAIPFLISVPFLFVQLKKGIGKTIIMERGRQTFGKITGKEPTNARIMSKIVYEYTFLFTAQNGQTHNGSFKTISVEQVDDKDLMVYYLPNHPGKTMVMNTIPGYLQK